MFEVGVILFKDSVTKNPVSGKSIYDSIYPGLKITGEFSKNSSGDSHIALIAGPAFASGINVSGVIKRESTSVPQDGVEKSWRGGVRVEYTTPLIGVHLGVDLGFNGKDASFNMGVRTPIVGVAAQVLSLM